MLHKQIWSCHFQNLSYYTYMNLLFDDGLDCTQWLLVARLLRLKRRYYNLMNTMFILTHRMLRYVCSSFPHPLHLFEVSLNQIPHFPSPSTQCFFRLLEISIYALASSDFRCSTVDM